jgi:hypothetical protein
VLARFFFGASGLLLGDLRREEKEGKGKKEREKRKN